MVLGTTLALASTGALAATVTVAGAPVKYSKEGVALAGGDLALPVVSVTLGENYSFNDIIEVGVNGATLTGAADQSAVLSCPNSPVTALTPTKPNTLRFRVADPAGATVSEVCTITNLEVVSSSVATGTGKFGVCWTGYFSTTDEVIDDGCTADTALTADFQISAKVDRALNAVIDVETKRLLFTVGDDSTTTDELDMSFKAAAAGFLGPNTVDVTAETVTLNGDFSWADGTDSGTTCSVTELDAIITQGPYTIQSSSSCSKIVLRRTGAPLGDLTHTFEITIPGTKALAPQVFTGNVTWAYNLTGNVNNSSTKSFDFAPGKWDINGALIYINYMPYNGLGGNISRIVYLSNRGTQEGAIDVTVLPESGGPACTFSPGTLKGGVVKLLSKELDAAVFTCFGNDFAGKVHMIVSVNAPRNDVEAYSAYNVGGSDRGTVVNTSNGRIVSGGASQ
jgi:hypothetical protein